MKAMRQWRSEFNAGIVLIGRAHAAKLIQRLRKQIIQQFQPVNVFDDAHHLKIKFVYAGGEIPAAPDFFLVVPDGKVDVGLGRDQVPDFFIGKEPAQFPLVIALDDEILVELRIAHGDVLHAQFFPEIAEKALAIDVEVKTIRVHIGRADPGVGNGRFAGGHGISIQRDHPRAMRSFHLAAVPKAAFIETTADSGGELFPDFVPAGPEQFLKKTHSVCGDSRRGAEARAL